MTVLKLKESKKGRIRFGMHFVKSLPPWKKKWRKVFTNSKINFKQLIPNFLPLKIPEFPLQWLSQLLSHRKCFRIHLAAEKNQRTIFINLFFSWQRFFSMKKVCFGFRLVHWAHGLNGREETVKNLWSHFGIITIYCS